MGGIGLLDVALVKEEPVGRRQGHEFAGKPRQMAKEAGDRGLAPGTGLADDGDAVRFASRVKEISEALLQDPNIATFVALLAVIGTVGLAKRVLDPNTNSILNNLFVGAVGLAGFVILLQGVRALF